MNLESVRVGAVLSYFPLRRDLAESVCWPAEVVAVRRRVEVLIDVPGEGVLRRYVSAGRLVDQLKLFS